MSEIPTDVINSHILGSHSQGYIILMAQILVMLRETKNFSSSDISFLSQIIKVFPCNNFVNSKICHYIIIFNTENIN